MPHLRPRPRETGLDRESLASWDFGTLGSILLAASRSTSGRQGTFVLLCTHALPSFPLQHFGLACPPPWPLFSFIPIRQNTTKLSACWETSEVSSLLVAPGAQRNKAPVEARLSRASKTFLKQPQQGTISCIQRPVFPRGSSSQRRLPCCPPSRGWHAGSISSPDACTR